MAFLSLGSFPPVCTWFLKGRMKLTWSEALEELGLVEGAETDEVRKAYKKQALEWHPDKNDDPGATEKVSCACAYMCVCT